MKNISYKSSNALALEDVLRHMLVGKSVDRANTLLNEMESNYHIRITKKDGVNYVITDDLVSKRLNVIVENGVITEFSGIG